MRRGLYDMEGSGILFFEYFRILTILKALNAEFFWLFENVNSMPIKYKEVISRFFECNPTFIDAQLLSAQKRPRFYWGNLPTLKNQMFCDAGVTLQDYLDGNHRANVDKIGTVTTRSNSIKGTKG